MRRGLTVREIDEAIRLWRKGRGLNMDELANLYWCRPHEIRRHFAARGIIIPQKQKKALARKAAL